MIPPDPTINLEVKMAQALGELQFRIVVLAAQTEHLSRQLAEVQAENAELKKKPDEMALPAVAVNVRHPRGG